MKHSIFPNNEKIDFSKKLNVKFGIDPTSDKLHLGHLIPLLEARKLWLQGHRVDIVLGTFTAQLGDPSGKDTMRPILDAETTQKNAQSIIEQVARIFGDPTEHVPLFKNIKIHFNHTWFAEMNSIEMVNILSKFTTTQLLSRDSFLKRINENNPIGMHELVVPILQGFDSVKLNTNVEIGGTDQLFNFAITRDVQRGHGQEPEVCMLMPIINGTDGRKMSKSFNNCIFINDKPEDVFGKTMSISDELMKEWWNIFFNEDFLGLIDFHPMEKKKELAWEITKLIWSAEEAEIAEKHFENKIQNKNVPTEMVEIPYRSGMSIENMIMQLRECSKSEAKRLIQSNAVKFVTDSNELLTIEETSLIFMAPGVIIKVGKKDFGKLI